MPFRIALSGFNAAATDLKVTGNNIANAGTNGFKQSRAEFVDAYAVSFGGAADTATGNGVRVATVAQQFSQGSIEFSDNALDLAISGAGFYVVSDASGQSYTRAGSFHVAADGNVVNSSDQALQVFPVNVSSTTTGTTTFNTGELSDLQLATSDGPPRATSNIVAGLNLISSAQTPVTSPFDPTDASSYNSTTSIITYDSLGSEHSASLYYAKTNTLNQWRSYLYVDDVAITPTSGEVDPDGIPTTTITFGPDGRMLTPATSTVSYVPILPTDLPTSTSNFTPLDFTLDYSNTTQFGDTFSVNALSQNGFTSGRLSGIDVDETGVVFARFTNGQSTALGKLALANFPNAQGLRQLGNTSWAQTFGSGDLILGEAGSGTFGLIQSGALEASNVDIASSLVNLITAQRNFQANAQVISTADTVTQTIINI